MDSINKSVSIRCETERDNLLVYNSIFAREIKSVLDAFTVVMAVNLKVESGKNWTVPCIVYVVLLCGHCNASYVTRNEIRHETCTTNAVCNIIHNRYWLPNHIVPLCNCTGDLHCPTIYSSESRDDVLHINSRTQMKFCTSIHDLPVCSQTDTAITVRHVLEKNVKKDTDVILHCLCAGEKYWRHQSRAERVMDRTKKISIVSDNYSCRPLTVCRAEQFCGFARLDYGFIFQRCTCPVYHKCAYDGETTKGKKDELFYHGPAFVARCIPDSNYEEIWT